MISLFIVASMIASPQGESLKKGKDLGKVHLDTLFEQIGVIDEQELIPINQKNQNINPSDAEKAVNSGRLISNEITDFLESDEVQQNSQHSNIHADEALFLVEYEKDSSYHIETCKETAEPIEVKVIRTLSIDHLSVSEDLQKIKECQGHRNEYKVERGKGEKKAEKRKNKFEKDPEIQSYHVEWKDRGVFHRDLIIEEFVHISNSKVCDNQKVTKESSLEQFLISDDQWVYQNPRLEDLGKDPNSALISTICLDNEPRVIDGREVKRCWVEELSYLYHLPPTKGCDFLKSQMCDLLSSKCLKQGPFGCALWERTFRCYKKLVKKPPENSNIESLFGIEEELWDVEYEPNNNFADVSIKLAVFQEIDREVKDSSNPNIHELSFFQGNDKFCSVSILDDKAYDCCNKMAGLTNEMYLSHCTSDELALYEQKEKGLCHYVGRRDGDFLNMWKSRDEHVYCCFTSKLSRVFNEKAKKQLGISWGTPEKPDCRGLTQLEIKSLDFEKLDLSEAYEAPNININEKLDRVTKKISDGLGEGSQ